MIEVVFDRLTLPDGAAVEIAGRLTSTDTTERRQINSRPDQRVVLVGGRGGIGAAIAGASGRSTNNLLGALGAMLSEGRNVDVPAGTVLAVELDRAVTLRGRGRARNADAGTIYTAPERVRAAQQELARSNYYRGPINGVLDDATRRALFEYQIDRNIRATGNLDGRTARALGIPLDAEVGGAVVSGEAASAIRRDAQSVLAQLRADLGASSVGRLDATRAYAQTDLDLWFAMSALADNAGVYEQIVRNGTNRNAATFAGRALVASARRVDDAMRNARTSASLQSGWSALRGRLTALGS